MMSSDTSSLGIIRLGVNIDHIATLREVRKAHFPDLIEAAEHCLKAGAHQITVHLREDRRHIQDRDVIQLLKWKKLPINMEMALTKEMISKAIRWQPESVTLVPEKRAEMTTESGLNLKKLKSLSKVIKRLKNKTKVYAFIDALPEQISLAAQLEFDGIEFHTGPWAKIFEAPILNLEKMRREKERLFSAAQQANNLGLEVKAGHGLNLQNLSYLLSMPFLSELNIGHSIVCRSLEAGLEAAVKEILTLIQQRTRS